MDKEALGRDFGSYLGPELCNGGDTFFNLGPEIPPLHPGSQFHRREMTFEGLPGKSKRAFVALR
jgi:hypothetical protein